MHTPFLLFVGMVAVFTVTAVALVSSGNFDASEAVEEVLIGMHLVVLTWIWTEMVSHHLAENRRSSEMATVTEWLKKRWLWWMCGVFAFVIVSMSLWFAGVDNAAYALTEVLHGCILVVLILIATEVHSAVETARQ